MSAAATVALAVALGLGGCTGAPGGSPPLTTSGPSATAPVSPSPTAAPTPTVDPAIVLAADGIGPYPIGADLAGLTSRGLVTDVFDSPICTGVKIAMATGRYAGQLTLTLRLDRLVAIYTNSPALQTPSGGKVEMTRTQLLELYGSRASLVTGDSGNQGILVRVPGSPLGVSFILDSANTKASAIGAGEAQVLQDAITSGEGC